MVNLCHEVLSLVNVNTNIMSSTKHHETTRYGILKIVKSYSAVKVEQRTVKDHFLFLSANKCRYVQNVSHNFESNSNSTFVNCCIFKNSE